MKDRGSSVDQTVHLQIQRIEKSSHERISAVDQGLVSYRRELLRKEIVRPLPSNNRNLIAKSLGTINNSNISSNHLPFKREKTCSDSNNKKEHERQ